jgi:hypothetical protein
MQERRNIFQQDLHTGWRPVFSCDVFWESYSETALQCLCIGGAFCQISWTIVVHRSADVSVTAGCVGLDVFVLNFRTLFVMTVVAF